MSALDRPLVLLKVAKEGSAAEGIDLGDRLKSMRYEDDVEKVGKLSLDLDNQDFRFLDEDTFKKGNEVVVRFGYAGNMQTATCIVHRISGSLEGELKVEAEHKGFLLHKNKKSRVWDNKTRSEVAREIAEKYNGYQPNEIFIEDTKVRHRHISQPAVTDAEFMKRLANKQGFEFSVDESGFHFHEKDWEQAPIKQLRWFTDTGAGEISSGTFESESKKKKGRVKSEGRDPITKKNFTVDSKNSTVQRHSLAKILEVPDHKSGQTTLQARIADDDLRPSTETTAPAAKSASDGAYKNQQRSTFKLSLTVVGDPKLRAKRVIEVTGIGKRYSGLWYITRASHEFGAEYLTKLECVRDAHNGHKGVNKDAKTEGAVNKKKVDDSGKVLEVPDERSGVTHLEWRSK